MTERPLLRPIAALALCAALAGCAGTNPATGRSDFTPFMPKSDEAEYARETHAALLARFGGAYGNPALGAYVDDLAHRLLEATETPDARLVVTLLDGDDINAFTAPGGNVYVTRGLIALAGSEDELAGVLAHEIGHVVARHPAHRYNKAAIASIGAFLLDVLTLGTGIADGARADARDDFGAFTREQEFEADRLGLRYMARAGYAPRAAVDFMIRLRRYEALMAPPAGSAADAARPDTMTAHPAIDQRIAAAARQVEGAPGARGPDELYLARIDGLELAGTAAGGYVRGDRVIVPADGIVFAMPEGMRVARVAGKYVGGGADGRRLVADRVAVPATTSLPDYVTRGWGIDAPLDDVATATVAGMDAVIASSAIGPADRPRPVRLAALRTGAEIVYRFLLAGAETGGDIEADFRELLDGIARPGPDTPPPLRLRVVAAPPGDAARRLAAAAPVAGAEDWIRALNGWGVAERPAPGSAVKTVGD